MPIPGIHKAEIFNMRGEAVAEIVLTNGHSQWDGTTCSGESAPAGVYCVRAEVAGKKVDNKTFNILENDPALLYGMDNGCKSIILEDHVRGLPGNLGATQPHGDADIRILQSRGVVDPVTGHGDDCSAFPVQCYYIKFLLGTDPGKKADSKKLFFLFRCKQVKRLKITAVNNMSIGIIHESNCKPDGLGSYRLVSRSHNDSDPGFPAFLQDLLHISPRWVDESDQTQKNQIFIGRRIELIHFTLSQCQDPQTRCSHFIILPEPFRSPLF